ncbi:MAG: ABC transporter permease [Planctomycetota bacterium]|jgi:hypothetical protein
MSEGMLEIRPQPRLPVSRQVEICADGVRHRFFRSLLTLGVVTLAVAFLMNMLTEIAVVRSCKRGAWARAERQEQLARLLGSVRATSDAAALQRHLAGLGQGTLSGRMLRSWTGLDAEAFAALCRSCRRREAALAWLAGLKLAHRRLLLADTASDGALAGLADPGARKRFQERLQQVPSVCPPPELPAAAAEFEDLTGRLRRAHARASDAAESLTAAVAPEGLQARLAGGGGVGALLAEHGLVLTESELEALTRQARQQERVALLRKELFTADMNRAWRAEYKDLFTEDRALEALETDSPAGQWLAARIGGPLSRQGLDAGDIPSVVRAYRQVKRTEALRDRLSAEWGSEEGIGTTTFWLVAMSFLVCIVGISNAMLVSVLERFREIATMKCLGAMDGLIAVLFLLEAAFLGTVGGAAGVVIGGAVGLTRMFSGLGTWVATFFPWGGLAAMAGVSILAGLLLTTLSAIYPAFRAARMAPMEAMRVE